MGVVRKVFESGGRRTEHLIPGAYTRVNFEAQSGGGVAAGNGVIIGDSKGGEPNRLLVFASPSEARAKLIDGALLEGVLHAFNPGGGYVPQRIGAVRVNVGTQAESILQNGATEQIELKAWDWGLHTNQLKRKLSIGTAASTHKVEIQLANGVIETFDNISHPSFSVQYLGDGTTASAEIDSDGLVVTVGVADDGITVAFDSFPTVEDIVNYLNDQPSYQAVLIAGDGRELATNLDHCSGIDVKSAVTTFNSDLQAIIDTFQRSGYIYSAIHPSTEASRKVPGYDSGWVYFSGGTSGTADATAYANALTTLEQEDVQDISTISTDEAIHLLILDHCQRMSSVEGRKERMALVGGAIGETIEATIARARNLASDLVSLAYPAFTAYNPIYPSQGLKECSSAMFACRLLGMEVSLAVNEPLTNKEVSVLGWEKSLTKGEIETLIEAGVVVGAKSDDGRLKIIRNVTTWQGSELQRCERSMVREAQYMARDFRASLNGGIGRPSNLINASTVASILGAKAIEWYNKGYIVKGSTTPLVWGLNLIEDGDAIFIEYHSYLTAPRNYIFGTANLHVLSQQVVAI